MTARTPFFFVSWFDTHPTIEGSDRPDGAFAEVRKPYTTTSEDIMTHREAKTLSSGRFLSGVLLVLLGACGLLDAAGVADWSATIGTWWPLALVAWATIDMVAARSVSLKGIVWTAIGVALLADVQEWASDVVIWSSLAVFVGLACMTVATLGIAGRDGRERTGDPTVHGGAL
jgi:hypothetical protein